MKILIFLAVWKRPEITEICFMGLKRLNENFGIEAFAVISEESMVPLCERYGVQYCFHENFPLGEKKNYGICQALKLDWDYIVEIGSDDLIRNEYFEIMKPYFGERDLFGPKSIAFLNTETMEARNFNGVSPFGLGRAISRRAVEETIWKHGDLWKDSLMKGLDNDSNVRMAFTGFMHKFVKSDEPLCIDLKSGENIWKFNPQLGVSYPIEKLLSGLSEDEVTSIKYLSCVV